MELTYLVTTKNVYKDATDSQNVFTWKTAIYFGSEDSFDDKEGPILLPNQPLAVCDKNGRCID